MSIKKQLDKSPKGLYDYKLVMMHKHFMKSLQELNQLRNVDKDITYLQKENEELKKTIVDQQTELRELNLELAIFKQELNMANDVLDASISFDLNTDTSLSRY